MKSGRKSSPKWEEEWKTANEFMNATENNLKLGDYKTAANRAYFTAERAIVASLKFKSLPVSKNHKEIWTNSRLLGLEPDPFDLLRDLYDMRLQRDYGSFSNIIELTEENLNNHISKVKDLLNLIKSKYKF